MDTSHACVVIGSQYNAAALQDPLVQQFYDEYLLKVPLPDGPDGFWREENNTRTKVFAHNDTVDYVVGGNQEGGNGGGGDASQNRQHRHTAIATRGGVSYWKIDVPRSEALVVSEASTTADATQTYPASDAVRTAYDLNNDPGCAFYFASHDAAYSWLVTLGKQMYKLYEVRIIAVNRSFL